jgi:hypothetical protein
MTLVWAAIVVGIAGLLLLVVKSRYRARTDADLGAVSDQWLAERRVGRPDS